MSTTLPRITARVDEDTQSLLSQAAALIGVTSINSFVLSAAIEKAKAIVEREQLIKLNQQDALLLAEALDSPAKVHPKLAAATKSYELRAE